MTERWTIDQFKAHNGAKAKKKGQGAKYSSEATESAGIKFDSRKEARRYGTLVLAERAGEIQDLELKPEYRLEVDGQLICKYFPDFRYKRSGLLIVEDVKSEATRLKPSYRLKKKLMKAIFNIEIKET